MTVILKHPVVALLAGGQSRRMLGADKALALIDGQRMIDRVLARLAPQAGTVLLSAGHDYGTGIVAVADDALGPAGPVGAIRALALYVEAHIGGGGADGFVTAPVDAPFLPDDLVARLSAAGPVAMARSQGAWQPAFAMWSAAAVIAQLPRQRCGEKWSLRRLGDELGARPVDFDGAHMLMNVNTPDDLAAAHHLVQHNSVAQARTR